MANLASSLYFRSVNDLVYDYALSSAYRSRYVYDPDFALAKDPDIWEIIRRDPAVFSAIDRRSKGIVRPWHVEPPMGSKQDEDKRLAGIVEDAIGKISMFDAARRNLANAAFTGRAYGFIEGEVIDAKFGDEERMDWWVPRRIRHIDRRRFHWEAEFTPGPNPSKTLHLAMWNTDTTSWDRVTPEFRAALIEYVYGDTEDRVGYGRGLMEAIYFYHYMKTITVEKIMQGVDRWANGILIGKLDSLRNASTSKTNEDLRSGMITLLQTMRSEHVAVMQDGDDIEVVETSGTGHEISMNFLKHLEEGIERLVNGSVLPSGMQSGEGSRSRAAVEQNSSEAFYQADRADLDEVLTRDLIGCFIRYNVRNLAKLGLLEASAPHINSEQVKREDPLEAVQIAAQLLQNGIPIIRQEIYHKTGFTMPEPGEDVIEGGMSMMGGLGDLEEGEDKKRPKDPGGKFAPKPKELKGKTPESYGDGEEDSGKTEKGFEKSEHFVRMTRQLEDVQRNLMDKREPQTTFNAHLVMPDLKIPTPQVTIQAPAPVVVPAPLVTVEAAAPALAPKVDVHNTFEPIVNVPQQPPAVAHFTAGDVRVDMSPVASAIQRLVDPIERVFAWMVGRKQQTKIREIEVSERDKDGNIKKQTITEREK